MGARWWAAPAAVLLLVVTVAAAPARGQTDQPEEIRGDGALLAGIYPDSFGDEALAEINSWAGKPVTFGGLFHRADENLVGSGSEEFAERTIWMLNTVWAAQATPFSNFETSRTAAQIASGAADDEIRRWAGHVGRWLAGAQLAAQAAPVEGRSLIIAPMQEMNGDWTPYGCYRNQAGTPVSEAAAYREAFRRFVRLVEEETGAGDSRLRWAFAPNGWTTPGCGRIADYYPGGDVVDVVALSGFNFGTAVAGSRWTSPSATLSPWVNELRVTVDPSKPYLIAQTATVPEGGDKDAWITSLFDFATADPNVVGLIWFNFDKPELGAFLRWKCCPQRHPAWAAAMQRPTTHHRWPLTAWFRPGPIPFTRVNRPPIARPETASVDEDGTVAVALLANDRDPDGFPLSVELVRPPAGGTVTIAADGTATYRNRSAPLSDSFTYVVRDDAIASEPQTVEVAIRPHRHAPGLVDPATARWHLLAGADAPVSFVFGNPGDAPLVGDWDCDGVDTPGVYRPGDGSVYLRNAASQGVADAAYRLGMAVTGDVALAGDWDGDGCDTVSLYRVGEGRMLVVDQLGAGGETIATSNNDYYFGIPGDQPFSGDFDADGVDTLGLHRASTGYVYFRQSHTLGVADAEFYYGIPGDRLTAGDWIGDGTDTVAVYRPATATLYLRHRNSLGVADEELAVGEAGWLPVGGAFRIGSAGATEPAR